MGLKETLKKQPFFPILKFCLYPILLLRKVYYRKRNKYLTLHNPKKLADICYYRNFCKHINWDNPQNLIEKQRWILHHTDISLWTLLADKYRVRHYLEERGWGNILVKLYGKWDKAEDIDFNSLPDSFVIKTNHGSGDVILVRDKKKTDLEQVRKRMKKFLNRPFGYADAEIQYLKIKPCIIAEELLVQDGPFPVSLVDYKFYVIHGQPQACGVFFNRKKDEKGVMTYDAVLYDASWNKMKDSPDFPKPVCYEQMIKFCSEMCSQFPFVRMDFYEVGGMLYFGEFTFTPAALGKSHAVGMKEFEEWGKLMNLKIYRNE